MVELAVRFLTKVMMFFRTYSPQGDGNSEYIYFCDFLLRISFSEPIPRKGTETIPKTNTFYAMCEIVFQNLFPARGRKQQHLGVAYLEV